MANVRVNVIHPRVYGVDSKVLDVGEQSIDSAIATKLVKRGVAVIVEKTKNDK